MSGRAYGFDSRQPHHVAADVYRLRRRFLFVRSKQCACRLAAKNVGLFLKYGRFRHRRDQKNDTAAPCRSFRIIGSIEDWGPPLEQGNWRNFLRSRVPVHRPRSWNCPGQRPVGRTNPEQNPLRPRGSGKRQSSEKYLPNFLRVHCRKTRYLRREMCYGTTNQQRRSLHWRKQRKYRPHPGRVSPLRAVLPLADRGGLRPSACPAPPSGWRGRFRCRWRG